MGKHKIWKCPKCGESTGALVYRDVGTHAPIRIPFRYCKGCNIFYRIEMKEVKVEKV